MPESSSESKAPKTAAGGLSDSRPARDSAVPSSRILTLPNILTLVRLLCLPLIVMFLLQRDMYWALILFVVAGITDFFDGLTARLLHQQTVFGMYLDPIADKLLLSSCFVVLAITGEVSWLVTGVVLARDAGIMVTAAILIKTTSLRRFPPTRLGKANTAVQLAAVFVVLLDPVYGERWLHYLREVLVVLTPVMVLASGVHYTYLTAMKLHRKPGGLG